MARERTRLAWARTAIAFAAVGAVVVRKDVIDGLIVLAGAPLMWAIGHFAVRNRRPDQTSGPVAGGDRERHRDGRCWPPWWRSSATPRPASTRSSRATADQAGMRFQRDHSGRTIMIVILGTIGWYRDPYGVHEDRYFSQGFPTKLVRDNGVESYDPPPGRLLPD